MAARRRKKQKTSAAAVWIVLLLAAVVVLIVYFVGKDDSPSEDTLDKDIVISGVDVSSLRREEALTLLEKAEEEIAAGYGVTLRYEDYERQVNAQELGISFNTEELLNNAKSGERLEITPSFDEKSISAISEEVGKAIAREVKEPSVEGFDFSSLTFSFEEGQVGLTLDTNALSDEIENVLGSVKTGEILLAPQGTAPKKVISDIEGCFGEISSYSTFCTNNENSEHNMRLAMEYMHQSVIGAGEIFSFNATTGDSTTAEGGWVQSGAWVNGELQDQYGGGLCQAATTFYNAALLGNMEVVERWEHMQPSTYCEIGLDATIDYPNLDLKMRNTTDYPIYVVSQMIDKTLTVTLYGYISSEYADIKLEGWETETVSMPAAEYELDSSMGEGEYVLERKGYEGSNAQAQRLWYDVNGNLIGMEELPDSSYSAVAPLYKIGPNTNTDAIPQDSTSGVAVNEPVEEDPGITGEGAADDEDPGITGEGVTNHVDPDQIRG